MSDAKDLGRRTWDRLHEHIPSYAKPIPFSGQMGRYPGDPAPGVTDRGGFVWVRCYGLGSQPLQAYSPEIKAWPDLPVLVADERETMGALVVIGENWGALGRPGGWLENGRPPWIRNPGYWIKKRRIVDFHAHPTGTGMEIEVFQDWFPVRTGTQYYSGGIIDLAPFVPVSGALFVHVYIQFNFNPTTGQYDEVLGAAVGDLVTGGVGPGGYPTTAETSEDYIPAVPLGAFQTLAVLLQAGQTTITEADCYDTRSIWNPAGDGGEPATMMGQVKFSRDGVTFTAELPMTDSSGGWLVDDVTGLMIVHDFL